MVAVLKRKVAHAADLVRRLAALDMRIRDHGMPGIVAVEVAQDGPDTVNRRVDHGRADDADHRRISAGTGISASRSPPGTPAGRRDATVPARAPAHSRTRPTIPQSCGCRRLRG